VAFFSFLGEAICTIEVVKHSLKEALALNLGIPAKKLVNPQFKDQLRNEVMNNFVSVKVYFSSLEVKTTTQVPQYTVRNQIIFRYHQLKNDLK